MRRPHSQRTRYSIRGSGTALRKPEAVSRKGLLNTYTGRGTPELGISFIGVERSVFKKNMPHHSQTSYTEYGTPPRGGKRRDRATSTELPACTPSPEETRKLRPPVIWPWTRTDAGSLHCRFHLPCSRGPSPPREITESSIHRH